MRVQINLAGWFLVMAVVSIVAYRFSEHRRLHLSYLTKFAKSHTRTNQTLVKSSSFKNGDGHHRIVFVFGERQDLSSIGKHFVLVTNSSMVPVAWVSFPHDCRLNSLSADETGNVVVNRSFPSGQSIVTKYRIEANRLVNPKPMFAIQDGGGPVVFLANIDFDAYQRLGDRRVKEPVGRWGNK